MWCPKRLALPIWVTRLFSLCQYGAVVLEYARAADDWETAQQLWPVVRRQVEILSAYVDLDNIFAAPAYSWVFIDWNDRLTGRRRCTVSSSTACGRRSC